MDPRVSQVIQILEEESFLPPQFPVHVGLSRERLTQEKLAFSVNLSESRLRTLFKAHTGRTPEQYRKQLKMEKVRELLETTHLKITEILTILDVGDQSHFKRDFKKEYGVCLTEYRKQCRSKCK